MNGKYDQVIDQYVPEGVALTDVQQSYLKAVVELYTKQKTVKMIDVAHHLNKSTGAVSSAMKTLSSKGVLETNSAGDIELLKKGTGQGGSNKATKTGVEKKTVSSSKSTKKASGNNKNIEVVTLYDSITFEMPHEYVLERDGNERCVFYLNEREDETGTLIYDYLYTLTVENFKNLKKGDNPVKLIQDSGLFKEWTEVSLKPYAALALENISNFIDKRVFYSLAYIASLSKSEVLIVRGKAIWDKNDQSYNLDKYNHFIDLINTIKSNGQSVPSVKMTAPVLLEKIHPVQTGNAEDIDMDELEEKCEKIGLSFWAGTITDCEDKSIEEIEIPHGVTEIGTSAFEECDMLRKVSIPDTVTRIEISAFEGCTALEEIDLPDSITEMQGCVFQNCTSLQRVKLPTGITSIAFSMFNGCENLTDVDIPEGVLTIENQAFNACASLTEIVIPDSIESIDQWAFDECDNLETVSLPDKDIEIGAWAIPDSAKVLKRPLGNSKPSAKSKTSKTRSSTKSEKPKIRFTIVMPEDENYSHYGKLKREHDKFTGMGIRHVSNNGKEHEAIPLTGLMERQGKTDNSVYKKLKAIEEKEHYDLKETALLIAQVFRVERSKFDARHDDEGDIGVTMLEKKWQFSALRSFAWTLADLADKEGKSIDDYDIDDLSEICRFIEERQWLNYEANSWFNGLCGHPDIHVYYMPQKMIDDGSADSICDVFKYNPIVSLDAFREDLASLKNSMIKLHNKLLENRDRTVRIESSEAAVLKAWCSMVMSAETAFFSEDGPMMFFHEYPETPLNTKPIPLSLKTVKPKKAAPKEKKPDPAVSVSDADKHILSIGADGIKRVSMGEYPAGIPIVWRILDDGDQDTYLMLSEYGLDTKPFNDMMYTYNKTGEFGKGTNEWHNSTLRQWLNEEFIREAFTQEERAMILEDIHDTYKMSSSGAVEETSAVRDKVFLLSAREVKKYFPAQKDMICKATSYAKEQGAEIEGGPMQCHWWCRSPAVELMAGLPQWVGCIMADGNGKGWGNSASGVCVRPVIRVNRDFIQTELIKNANDEAKKKTQQAKKTGKYTLDMLPEGQEDAEAILAELNEMDPEQAENTLSALIAVHNLQKELADLSAMIGGDVQEEEDTTQREVEERRKREIEDQRQRERESLTREIAALEKERDEIKGLFAGFKRSKIQSQINELKNRLKSI